MTGDVVIEWHPPGGFDPIIFGGPNGLTTTQFGGSFESSSEPVLRKSPGQAGASFTDRIVNPRTVSLQCVVNAKTLDGFYEKTQELVQSFGGVPGEVDTPRIGTLRIKRPGQPVVETKAEPVDSPREADRRSGTTALFDIEWLCPSPHWNEINDQVVTFDQTVENPWVSPTLLAGSSQVFVFADSINIPVPDEAEPDDVLFVWIHSRNNRDIVSAPSGWTLVSGPDTSGLAQVWLYQKAVATDDPGFWTWNFDGPQHQVGICAAIRGADTSNPINAGGATNGATGVTEFDVSSITPTKDGCQLLAMYSIRSDSEPGPEELTHPANMSKVWADRHGVDFIVKSGGSYLSSVPDIATGARTVSNPTAGDWRGTLIAVEPSPLTDSSSLLWTSPWESPSGNVEDTIVNPGNVPVGFRVRFHGPQTGLRLTNVTTGQRLHLNHTLQQGKFVEVDTELRTVTQDGVSLLDTWDFNISSWWKLRPGSNIIRVESNTAAPGARTVILWRPAYGGI